MELTEDEQLIRERFGRFFDGGIAALEKFDGPHRVANCLEFGEPEPNATLLERAQRLKERGWEYRGGQFYLRPVERARSLREAEQITQRAREIGLGIEVC